MAVRQIRDEKLAAIAEGFRSSRGTTEKLSLDEMAVLAAEKTGGSGGDGSPRVIDHVVNLAVDVSVKTQDHT